MTFQFPYENILRLKEREKDISLSTVGRLLQKKEALQRECNSLVQKRDQCIHEWEQANEVTYVSTIQKRNDYLEYINKKISSLEAQLEDAGRELAEKEIELLGKQKEEKTWQLLKEKESAIYSEKQKKIEQEFIDEIATVRHFHQLTL